jgi:hypothetical protein
LPDGVNNSAIAELATLGPCSSLANPTSVSINEVTTIGVVWPLVNFIRSTTLVGSESAGSSQLAKEVETGDELVDMQNGTAGGPALPAGSTVPMAKLYTLANILASCIGSAGGSSGDGSACGRLFALSTTPDQPSPRDTVEAAIAIARYPTLNVDALFSLSLPKSAIQPLLSAPPVDWTLPVGFAIPPPVSSLASGTYSVAQQLTLSDSLPGATIYYTTNGATPTEKSAQFTGPIIISSSQTIEAIAILGSMTSVVTVLPVLVAPPVAVSVTPGVVTLSPSEAADFTATVTGAHNTNVIWTLSLAVGSISTGGLYTAPPVVAASQTVTIVATSIADSTKKAVATVILKPAITVAIAPADASISTKQTQQFTATVLGSSNSAVHWSISPELGGISDSGLYTPPTTVNTSQAVMVTATSSADSSRWAASTLLLVPAATEKTYYISPTGSESNSGVTSNAPWLTPNHQGLNCGDTVIAAPGMYNAMTITSTPSCSTHDAVWVKCATFDGCKINQDVWTQGGINVQASNWAFVGWEVTARSGPYAACFSAVPGSKATRSIHDIYFINDVANGCMAGGFISAPTGKAGVDYFLAVADVVYNAAQSKTYCYSGVSVWEPIATDASAGTHIYVSQIFAWHNIEPSSCAGGNSTDGEGIIFDTFNGSQSGLPAYAQQAAIENVITVYNGAFGVLAGGGSGNSSAPMLVSNATAYGNFINSNQNQYFCAQMASLGWPTTNSANVNRYTSFTNNLAVTQASHLSGCGNNTPFAYYFGNIDGTDSFTGNAGFSVSGQSIGYAGLMTGFVKGVNLVGQDPLLANPVEPPPPSCGGKSSVIDCMSGVVANFKPKSSIMQSYGYQPPNMTATHDPLFPRWLCGNPNMPLGLVTMGCLDK